MKSVEYHKYRGEFRVEGYTFDPRDYDLIFKIPEYELTGTSIQRQTLEIVLLATEKDRRAKYGDAVVFEDDVWILIHSDYIPTFRKMGHTILEVEPKHFKWAKIKGFPLILVKVTENCYAQA